MRQISVCSYNYQNNITVTEEKYHRIVAQVTS